MGTSFDWDAVSIAAIVAAVCCVVCAVICIGIWRKFGATNFDKQITAGDSSVRAYAEAELAAIRDSIARIEQRQETEAEHVLRPRDLGRVHDKINAVALDVAGMRSDYRGITEQLKLLQRLFENRVLHINHKE